MKSLTSKPLSLEKSFVNKGIEVPEYTLSLQNIDVGGKLEVSPG